MRQIGMRQEASRLGGLGSCGRELCCSTWLTDFKTVSTSAARYQNLSLNTLKLAGQCGKLKCCLNYELDTYLDALKDLPDLDTKVYTEKGDAVCQKVDIFKGLMWFAYTDNMAHWHVINADQVKEIIALNKQKQRAASLEDYAVEPVETDETIEKNFQNVVGQDSLTRFDKPKNKKKKRPNKKKPAGAEAAVTDKPATGDNNNRQQGNRNNNNSNRPKNKRRKPNNNKPSNDKDANTK